MDSKSPLATTPKATPLTVLRETSQVWAWGPETLEMLGKTWPWNSSQAKTATSEMTMPPHMTPKRAPSR